jgi:hypothetical protein
MNKMGDGEIGYDICGEDESDEFCSECGRIIEKGMIWDGECLKCEDRMILLNIEDEFMECVKK